jgi:hypothetical protein
MNIVMLCRVFKDVLWNMPQQKKAKEFSNRLGVAQRFPGGLGSQIFMTFGI